MNWGKLPPALIEETRAAHRRCEPRLSTTPTRGEVQDRDLETKRLLLVAVGHTEGPVEKMRVPKMETGALVEAIRWSPARRGAGASQRQHVPPESELPRCPADAWIARMPSTGRSVLASAPVEINPPRNGGRHGNPSENGRSGKGRPCLGHRGENFPFRSSLASLSRISLYPLRLEAEARTFWLSRKRNPFLSVGNFAQTLSGTRSSNP